MARRPTAGLLGAALLLAACTGSDGSADSAPTAAPTSTTLAPEATAEPSAGCDATEDPPTGQTDEEITSSGMTRTYRRMVPSSAEAGTPLPVVFNFHGLGSNADEQNAFSGMEDLGEQEGFVVLTPQGRGDPPFWAFSNPTNPDFVLVTDLVAATGDALCIDLARVFATGMSNGGLMSSGLACRLPDTIAAVSAVSGLASFDDCDTSRPVAVQVIYGTADEVLPYEGGIGDRLQAAGIPDVGFPGIPESMADWAALEGCDPEPEEEVISEEVTRLEWPNCTGEVAVVHYRVEGGGHTWPGTPLLDSQAADDVSQRLGFTTDDIDASELAWEFFQAHPRPTH
jgi:polyhydroxybutyrate depolymerase